MRYNPEDSQARKYIIELARARKLRLTEAQMQTAIHAVDHLMQETGSDKINEYILGLIVKAAVTVEDEAKTTIKKK